MGVNIFILKTILEQLNGQIHMVNNANEGTIITFCYQVEQQGQSVCPDIEEVVMPQIKKPLRLD